MSVIWLKVWTGAIKTMITAEIISLFGFWFLFWVTGYGFGFKLQAIIRFIHSAT